MNLKFWDKKEPAKVPEPMKERSYFETVAETGMASRMLEDVRPTVSGPETAMKLATVYRCVSILSGSIASLPLQLLRKKNGVFMVDEDNPVNYLLSLCPNGRQSAFEMIRNAIIMMNNQGNAYIYPDYSSL